jgi:hypothetical protein
MGFKVKGRLKKNETYLKHDENFGGRFWREDDLELMDKKLEAK